MGHTGCVGKGDGLGADDAIQTHDAGILERHCPCTFCNTDQDHADENRCKFTSEMKGVPHERLSIYMTRALSE